MADTNYGELVRRLRMNSEYYAADTIEQQGRELAELNHKLSAALHANSTMQRNVDSLSRDLAAARLDIDEAKGQVEFLDKALAAAHQDLEILDMLARHPVISEIAAERRRQIEVEGFTAVNDLEHSSGQLAEAAACYARHDPQGWPWDSHWWKPKDERRDLIRAAALIVAQIERLDRDARRRTMRAQDRSGK